MYAVPCSSLRAESEKVGKLNEGRAKRIEPSWLQHLEFGFEWDVDVYPGQLIRGVELRATGAAHPHACVHDLRKIIMHVERYSTCDAATFCSQLQIQTIASLEHLANDALYFNSLTVLHR